MKACAKNTGCEWAQDTRDSKVPCSLSIGGFRGLPNQTRKEIHSAQNKYNYITPTALGKIEKIISIH